ncbi:MAG TPA: hypothetical protein VGR50_04875, partial [Terriglobales bacterium]|nr:hypothetical protein [Terriglobales bacterium]
MPMLAQERSEAEAEHAQGEGNRIIERERWFYEQREFPLGHIPPGAHAKALARRKQMEAEEFTLRQSGAAYSLKQFSGTSWSLIGPQATSSPFYKPYVSGRVSALAVDPTDPNTVYLGGAEGGVWKTTNGGANWTPLTDGQASLATGSIAIDPQNHTTIYVGTGEENFGGDNYYGAGVLKSTDAGASWSHLPGPFVGPTNSNPPSGGAYIGSIAVQPGNSQVLLAGVLIYSTQGTNFGQNIMRSTDGGVSWSTVLPGGNNGGFGGNSTAVLFDPTV